MKKGDKVVMWYVSSNRDESKFKDPDTFDLRRSPNDHQAFGGGGRHYCLGTALARLELKTLIEESLRYYPEMEIAGEPRYIVSGFVNQLRTLHPVEAVEHAARDLADLVGVLGDPLRREAALEERLEPVVLGRVHADEHGLAELERQDGVGDRGDSADLRGVGLPVAAYVVDIVVGGDRPVTRLLGEVGHGRRPVDRALAAHAGEELAGRAVLPGVLGEGEYLADRDLGAGGVGRHASLPPGCGEAPVWQRV
ncbi:MAG: cytochrome P450 [Solirubrobacterales bacterium]